MSGSDLKVDFEAGAWRRGRPRLILDITRTCRQVGTKRDAFGRPSFAVRIRGDNLACVSDLTELFVAIAASDQRTAFALLDAGPSLVTAGLARDEEFLVAERLAQVYQGDTALHAAAFSYDTPMARELVGRGANIRARNRRGAEPLHAAVMGGPGAPQWNPTQQRAVIALPRRGGR